VLESGHCQDPLMWADFVVAVYAAETQILSFP
jgi:hypothetical protein